MVHFLYYLSYSGYRNYYHLGDRQVPPYRSRQPASSDPGPIIMNTVGHKIIRGATVSSRTAYVDNTCSFPSVAVFQFVMSTRRPGEPPFSHSAAAMPAGACEWVGAPIAR